MNLARKTDSPDYVPTLNRMGYMSPSLDDIQKSFVKHCENNSSGHFLDIGCGYGIATLPAILKGCHVIACDLEQRHLNVLKEQIPADKRFLLTLIKGHFANEIVFPEDSFDGINLSMVLHFLSPQTIKRVLKNIFLALKEEGKLFITTSSPYQGVLSSFAPIYDKRKGLDEWPGYIEDIAQYVPHRALLLPKENIVFCPTELSRLLSKFGFHVLKATFFSREGIPSDLKSDGREYSGVICEKPKTSSLFFLEKNSATIPTVAANKI